MLGIRYLHSLTISISVILDHVKGFADFPFVFEFTITTNNSRYQDFNHNSKHFCDIKVTPEKNNLGEQISCLI
ncbi:LOW QUALITY PROTEIN: tRNA (guanine(9)-N1)-methyltransferase [Frankliniella fusca]|uniref:tRNA (Guanine(9)-N1)-methyltransferase n=1 Tax=Frankliniella fusca TaxID=407009 RepID=A0AAE1LE40_9NEOP|nr:LOW QUALITY PROTEIN: tRNA (guanine(9)-N1)-methyltransferase [Frankliniella fusca]